MNDEAVTNDDMLASRINEPVAAKPKQQAAFVSKHHNQVYIAHSNAPAHDTLLTMGGEYQHNGNVGKLSHKNVNKILAPNIYVQTQYKYARGNGDEHMEEDIFLNGNCHKQNSGNIINCMTYGINDKRRNNGVVKIMSISECNNNNIDKFMNLTDCNKKFLKIIHFNAQGLLEGMHFEQICDVINKFKLDIIAISETWLNQAISNKTMSINGYQVFRSDRNFNRSIIKKGGGGVCMYVRNGLKVTRTEKSHKTCSKLLDFLFLEIQSSTSKFLICNIYRRGDNPYLNI